MSSLFYCSVSSLNRDCKGKQLQTSLSTDKFSLNFCSFLFKRGYISSYMINGHKLIVHFKYINNRNLLNGISFISTPGHRIYCSYHHLLWLNKKYKGRNFFVLRTTKGFLTSSEAIHQHIGGELICRIHY
jgi:ribosomal protein S8